MDSASFRTIGLDHKEEETMTITVQVPDALLEDLATSPEELDREIRLAAALHLYSRGLVSQGKGAEIAGLSRWEFIQALQSPGCELVIDDRAGRRCAEAHGIPVLDTVGLVILAKRLGRITEARPIIEDLRRVGLYVKDNVIADALKQAGE
jgi:predicted HTH domain antitoxin